VKICSYQSGNIYYATSRMPSQSLECLTYYASSLHFFLIVNFIFLKTSHSTQIKYTL